MQASDHYAPSGEEIALNLMTEFGLLNLVMSKPWGISLTVVALLTVGTGTPASHAAVGDVYVGEDNGTIERFQADGTGRSTFASGLGEVTALAFDHSGDLFAACGSIIYKFDQEGHRTTFSAGFLAPFYGFGVDSSGNLYGASRPGGATSSEILRFAHDGSYSVLDSGYLFTYGLQFDSSDNLYVVGATNPSVRLFKYPPGGSRTTFGMGYPRGTLAIDSSGDVFLASYANIFKYTPDGTRTSFSLNANAVFSSLAFDGNGVLFAADSANNQIWELAQDGTGTTFIAGLSGSPESMAILVPEPSPMTLLVFGGVASGLIRRKGQS